MVGDMSCKVYKVWRYGRPNTYVCRPEAGVFFRLPEYDPYYGKPGFEYKPLFDMGNLRVHNQICLANVLDSFKSDVELAEHLGIDIWTGWNLALVEARLTEDNTPLFRFMYPIDCAIAAWAREQGYDGILYKQRGTLVKL